MLPDLSKPVACPALGKADRSVDSSRVNMPVKSCHSLIGLTPPLLNSGEAGMPITACSPGCCMRCSLLVNSDHCSREIFRNSSICLTFSPSHRGHSGLVYSTKVCWQQHLTERLLLALRPGLVLGHDNCLWGDITDCCLCTK